MVDRAPPLRWLFDSSERRAAVLRYWIRDTAMGFLNTSIHNGLRLLPTGLCSGFGAVSSALSPLRFKESDARARLLWQRFHPDDAEPAHLDRVMRSLWRCVGRTMAEYSVLDRFWREGRIEVEGDEHLRAARALGHPIIIASVHLGNWETVGPVLVAFGFPGSGFYEPPENRFDHKIAVKVRLRYGAKLVFPTSVGGREAYRLLTDIKDEVFLIYIDEIFQGRVSAPALGRTPKPEGNIAHTARLARMTGASVVPAYCVRLGDSARFKVTFLPPIRPIHTDDRKADLMANILALDRTFAPIVQKHLDQWYYTLDFEM
jgi:KDO2-lipid IV(A) lauroyltransferase